MPTWSSARLFPVGIGLDASSVPSRLHTRVLLLRGTRLHCAPSVSCSAKREVFPERLEVIPDPRPVLARQRSASGDAIEQRDRPSEAATFIAVSHPGLRCAKGLREFARRRAAIHANILALVLRDARLDPRPRHAPGAPWAFVERLQFLADELEREGLDPLTGCRSSQPAAENRVDLQLHCRVEEGERRGVRVAASHHLALDDEEGNGLAVMLVTGLQMRRRRGVMLVKGLPTHSRSANMLVESSFTCTTRSLRLVSGSSTGITRSLMPVTGSLTGVTSSLMSVSRSITSVTRSLMLIEAPSRALLGR
jgi:hypothetical protein